MIDKLTKNDIGKKVTYNPGHPGAKDEIGIIHRLTKFSEQGEQSVFVKYLTSETPQATPLRHLTWPKIFSHEIWEKEKCHRIALIVNTFMIAHGDWAPRTDTVILRDENEIYVAFGTKNTSLITNFVYRLDEMLTEIDINTGEPNEQS